MWNKPQDESDAIPTPPAQPTSNASPSAGKPERQAILGPSISIKGSLSGEEDLLIEGHVEGEISFKKHTVTVGKRGRVDADLYCKSIYVEGEVHGNLYGDDLVVVRKSAHVQGNAVAPRVSLEDGSQFHGAIDMQPKQTKQTQQSKPESPVKPIPPAANKPETPEQKGPGHDASVQR